MGWVDGSSSSGTASSDFLLLSFSGGTGETEVGHGSGVDCIILGDPGTGVSA